MRDEAPGDRPRANCEPDWALQAQLRAARARSFPGHTAAFSKESPVLPTTSGWYRPRRVELRGPQPGCCSPKGKGAISIQAHLPSLPVPGPFSPGALGHPSGRPPENGFVSEGSGVDSRERDWSKENWGLQSAAIGEGSEKGASGENQGGVGPPRSQQPVRLQLIANLGWETDSGPLGGPPPEGHPLRSARAGRCRAQLGKPRP